MHQESPSWAQETNRRVNKERVKEADQVAQEKAKAEKVHHHFDENESSEDLEDFYPSSASPSTPSDFHHHTAVQKDATPRFFQTLRTSNTASRKRQLEKIIRSLRFHTSGVGQDLEFVRGHIPSMVLLAVECPYAEVRRAFQEFLSLLAKEKGLETSSIAVRNNSFHPARHQEDMTLTRTKKKTNYNAGNGVQNFVFYRERYPTIGARRSSSQEVISGHFRANWSGLQLDSNNRISSNLRGTIL